MAIEALVFDVDGTLADTERDGHRVAFNLAFRQSGLDWDWTPELYGALLAVTGGKERIGHYLAKYNSSFEVPGDPDAFVAALHKRKTAHFVRLVEAGAIALRPGVERLLREARAAGLRLAISTTTTLDNVNSLIGSTLGDEALRWFEVIGAGDVVSAKKPAPDIYIWVLERLRLSPDRVIAFEDSGHGVRAAADAGISRILVTCNAYTAGQDFGVARAVLDNLGEIHAPARVRSGPPLSTGCVDLAYLNKL